MFAGNVVTDEQGKPKVDSQSGAVVIEDGVC